MFDRLQSMRNAHAQVIYGAATARSEVLRAALADLDEGLQDMRTAEFRDLAHGWLPLASRKVDFMIDRIRVLYMLGDHAQAIGSWRELMNVAWVPPDMVAHGDAGMRDLLLDASASDLRARSLALSRMADQPPDSAAFGALTWEQRIQGLSTVWSVAKQYFVWFDHVPELDWDAAYREALGGVISAPDDEAYWRELMRFTALLRDGHSNAFPPESLAKRLFSRPGLRTAKVEDRVLVMNISDRALHSQMRVGDEILAIDGVPVMKYAESKVMPLQSSSTPQDLAVRTYDYGLLAGPSERPVRLDMLNSQGSSYTAFAPRSGFETIDQERIDPFQLRHDGVAVLKADQFENDEAARALESRLEDLRHARGLVIDMRGNGGGSTENGTRLLRYLTSQPIPRSQQLERMTNAELASAPVVMWRPVSPPSGDPPVANPFVGAVAVLVDARTFSAAEDTVAMFRMMQRGPIVGTPTGGSTGQPISRMLPGGGVVRICAKRDSYADGSDFVGKGIQPDVLVAVTGDAVRQGRDEALERAAQAVLHPMPPGTPGLVSHGSLAPTPG